MLKVKIRKISIIMLVLLLIGQTFWDVSAWVSAMETSDRIEKVDSNQKVTLKDTVQTRQQIKRYPLQQTKDVVATYLPNSQQFSGENVNIQYQPQEMILRSVSPEGINGTVYTKAKFFNVDDKIHQVKWANKIYKVQPLKAKHLESYVLPQTFEVTNCSDIQLKVKLPKTMFPAQVFEMNWPKGLEVKEAKYSVKRGDTTFKVTVDAKKLRMTTTDAMKQDCMVELPLSVKANQSISWHRVKFVVKPQKTESQERVTISKQTSMSENTETTTKVSTSSEKEESVTTQSKEDNTTSQSTTTIDSKDTDSSSVDKTEKVTTDSKDNKSQLSVDETTSSDKTTSSTITQQKNDHSIKRYQSKKQSRSSLNNSGVVTSIRVSPTSVNDGDTVRFEATFAERYDGQIKPGDTITFNFPKSQDGYVTPFNRAIQVKDQYGITIGTLTMNGQQAVITFNENVRHVDNIRGHVYFDCEARNVKPSSTDQTIRFDSNFGISNLPKTSISIKKKGTGTGGTQPGKSPFYYKTGRMYPEDANHVRWWLSGNLNKDYLGSDIRIEDRIQEGHEMVWSSFRISFTGGSLNGKTMTMAELNRSNYGYVKQIDNHSFNVHLYQRYMRRTSFTITYLTKITDDTLPQFKNDSKIWYRTYYGDDVGEGKESNFIVDNIVAGGDADANQLSQLTIEKRDKTNATVLMGAEFTLIHKATGKKYTEVTDGKGVVEWFKLPYGEYTLEETRAPRNYERITTVYNVKIDRSGITISNKDDFIKEINDSKIVITNQKKTPLKKIPNTGGNGTGYYISLGLLLIGLGYILNRKVRKKL